MKNGNCTVLAFALLALAAISTQIRAQSTYTPYAFTNFAGLPGIPGTNDGTGSAARFGGINGGGPSGLAVDNLGNVYVADTQNHTIRKITPGGDVTTLAGSAGQVGSVDDTGSAARFRVPYGVAVDTNGNIYVTDYGSATIRKVTPAGAVTTLAGNDGEGGSSDGTGSAARFNNPTGVAVDTAGNVYVGDTFNFTIRKIAPDGVVTTLAGSAGQGGTNDGTGSAARFSYLTGVAVDTNGNVYVADTPVHTIRKITPAGTVTTIAGSAGQPGANDGIGSGARFKQPYGVAVDTAGNIYVADTGNQAIRKITPSTIVTTLAGSPGQFGNTDGTGDAAQFYNPLSVAVDSAGNVYVADTSNQRVTKGTPLLQFDIGIGVAVSNDFFKMRLIGPSGSNSIVEASTDFAVWTSIQTNALPPFGLDVSVPLDTNQNKFFRARLAP